MLVPKALQFEPESQINPPSSYKVKSSENALKKKKKKKKHPVCPLVIY